MLRNRFSRFSIQTCFDFVHLEDCIDRALQLVGFPLPFSQNAFVDDIQASPAQGRALCFHSRIAGWITFLCIADLAVYQIVDFLTLQASLGNGWRIHPRMSWNQNQN